MRIVLGIVTTALWVLFTINSGAAQSDSSDSFRAEGERWFVTPGALDSYDSKLADQDLKVTSESGRIGYAQPAWMGKKPLDVGRLWDIQDGQGAVIAECERLSSDEVLHCMTTEGSYSMRAE